MDVIAVLSHWDVDGVAAAAIARRCGARLVKLSSTSALPKMLEDLVRRIEGSEGTVIIADLNPNPHQARLIAATIDYAVSSGLRIVWVDHHVWSEETERLIREAGAELYLESSTVSAELVRRVVACEDGVCKRLVHLALSDDLFIDYDPYAVKWRRILRWFDWSVRYRAVESLAEGRIWPLWAQELWSRIAAEYDNLLQAVKNRVRLQEVDGLKVALIEVPSEKLHPGEVHRVIVESGVHADLYILIYEHGVSLRSDRLPLSCIARALGGGGHEKAAGAPWEGDTSELIDALREAIRQCISQTTSQHSV